MPEDKLRSEVKSSLLMEKNEQNQTVMKKLKEIKEMILHLSGCGCLLSSSICVQAAMTVGDCSVEC
jgi:hypothetical protein